MVHCVAFGCKNQSIDGKKSFFRFPNREKKRKQFQLWVAQVRRKDFTPNKFSCLCSDHFDVSCFNYNPEVMAHLEVKPKLTLVPGAVPTRFVRKQNIDGAPVFEAEAEPKVRSAYVKRRHREVLQELCFERNEEAPTPAALVPGNKKQKFEGAEQQQNEQENFCKLEVSTQTTKSSSSCFTQTEKLKTCSQGIMVIPPFRKTKNAETQTDISSFFPTITVATQCSPILDASDEDDGSTCSILQDDRNDQEWKPDDVDNTDMCCDDLFSDEADGELDMKDDDEHDDDDIDSEIDITNIEEDFAKERKYVVFESCLKSLMTVCFICSCLCRVVIKKFHGSMVVIESCCSNGHIRKWASQPVVNKLPLGNLLISGGILFSGSSPSNVLNCLKRAGIATFTDRTYRRIQSGYLVPAINNIWSIYQQKALEMCEGRSVKLGGDARCCSPGHTAKYGSYSLMDLETGNVLDVQLVQVTEVKNSFSMEIEGLKRGIRSLKNKNLHITDLTTDRHVQVKKYMKEETSINHWFDVWHMAKGINKKVLGVSKKKGCEDLSRWAHSLSNHLYWSAASSNGNGDMVEAKWKSISNHVCDIHVGHGETFPVCQHGELRRKWLKKGSKVHKELEVIVSNPRIIKDIRRLSPAEQTSQLEAYHKVVCQFAPKFQHFFYDSMKARLFLAAMHTNENASRQQATKKDGSKRWAVSYPKYKQGGHVVKAIKEECTYGYVDELMEEALKLRGLFPTYKESLNVHKHTVPLQVTSNYKKVDTSEAIISHRTRFSTQLQNS